MTASVDRRRPARGPIAPDAGAPLPTPAPVRWNRPLLVLAAAMLVLAAASAVGLAVDPREVTGLPVWAKPLKFALSTAIYAVTLAWLLGLLGRRRLAAWVGGTTAAMLGVELVLITGAAALGTTSHFNVSTLVNSTVWYAMAGSIVVVWSLALLVAVLLWRAPLGDPARTLAIRSGAVLAVVGMGLAFLMTVPPQADFVAGVGGAHTVGLADGGPGLPVLGWSTVGGDLRVPHFIGMHALQGLPIAAILFEMLARRVPALRDAVVRTRLVALAAIVWTVVVALVTVQALAGQSVVAPAGPVLVVGVATATAFVVAAALILLTGRRTA
jgi:hypothetical protein